jgi:hypothetical protein
MLFCWHFFSPLNTYMRKGKEPDPYPYLWLIDPDPGGPKTCGSESGSGSGCPTLVLLLRWSHRSRSSGVNLGFCYRYWVPGTTGMYSMWWYYKIIKWHTALNERALLLYQTGRYWDGTVLYKIMTLFTVRTRQYRYRYGTWCMPTDGRYM